MSDIKPVPEAQEIPENKGSKGSSDPNEINPKLASDTHYWAGELHVTGQQLHEAYPHAWNSRGENPRGAQAS
jgi:hypothetical protein